MRPPRFWPFVLPLLYALALYANQIVPGRADDGRVFIIAAAQGYGLDECLAEGGDCGHVVADAWCEAHGHGAALSFGVADDVTGAIPSVAGAAKSPAPYFVRCGD